MISSFFLPKSIPSDFGRKPWTVIIIIYNIVGHFAQILYSLIAPHWKVLYTKVIFTPFCSLGGALPGGTFFAKFEFSRNHGLNCNLRRFDQIPYSPISPHWKVLQN